MQPWEQRLYPQFGAADTKSRSETLMVASGSFQILDNLMMLGDVGSTEGGRRLENPIIVSHSEEQLERLRTNFD